MLHVRRGIALDVCLAFVLWLSQLISTLLTLLQDMLRTWSVRMCVKC